MILIDSIKIKADIKSDDDAILITTKKYNIKNARNIKIVKKSIDARKKDNIQYIFSIALNCDNEDILIKKNKNISGRTSWIQPAMFNSAKVAQVHFLMVS